MSRRREATKRAVLPDPKFGSEFLARFVNSLMQSGKKSVAERIVYGALDRVTEKTKGDPLAVLNQAFDNVKPAVEVKSRRVGGATYQVPVEVRSDRQSALAMRWIIDAARARGEKSMGLRLAGEILDAAEKRGSAVKKREDTHRMAEANKAFSHYRW
ncbi:MAG: 30S ribosomal protein S7 [Pseudomonadota bacterium]